LHLLRHLRHALPVEQADVGSEAAAWLHPAFRRGDFALLPGDIQAIEPLREAFRGLDPDARRLAWNLIRAQQREVSLAVRMEERALYAALEGCTDPEVEAFLDQVAAAHENGWTTGSTGWNSQFSTEESHRLILRSQGTAISSRMLVNKCVEIPGKYFSVAKVYRPDVVDRTHLTEFHHLEGIILGEELTFRNLLGTLESFAREVAGAEKVRFRPDYFPFTEPSVELNAYKEGYGWVEFGGSGIFRPEVTLPLGIKAPVIAWGLGVDRLFMMKAGIDDIRSIFSQDLDWLRRKQVT